MGNPNASPKSIQALASPLPKGQDIQKVSFTVRKRYIELLSVLPEEYIQRNHRIQDKSRFWNALEGLNTPVSDDGYNDKGTIEHITINEADWSEYVTQACRIYIEFGLSDEQVLGILSQTIAYVAVCALHASHRRVYFEDGVKVFFEPCDRGMAQASRQKYEMLLERMRARMAEIAAKEKEKCITLNVSGGDYHDQNQAQDRVVIDHDHDHDEKQPASVVQASPTSTTIDQPLRIPIPRASLNENQNQQDESAVKLKPKKKKDKKNKSKKSEGTPDKGRGEIKPVKRKLFHQYVTSEPKKQKFWWEKANRW